jgi:hypothetical protein
MNISIHIERLILDGPTIPPGDRPLMKAALEAELARLLGDGSLSPELRSGGAVPSLSAASIQLAREITPTQLGHQIARAVYGAIGRE